MSATLALRGSGAAGACVPVEVKGVEEAAEEPDPPSPLSKTPATARPMTATRATARKPERAAKGECLDMTARVGGSAKGSLRGRLRRGQALVSARPRGAPHAVGRRATDRPTARLTPVSYT